jgi:hypothetical protein
MRSTTAFRAVLAPARHSVRSRCVVRPSRRSSPDPNDALRALVPEGEPGDLDVTQGDTIYKQIAAEVGKSTAVPTSATDPN